MWCEEDKDLEAIIIDYFGELFQSSHPDVTVIDEMLATVEARITPEMNALLSTQFTADEVLLALKQMSPLKSPGPDGLPVIFFNKYWHVLGTNIISCVLDLLNLHLLPQALNYTFIVLIPKTARPIALRSSGLLVYAMSCINSVLRPLLID